jgi:3D-(3,5/4)-trihydroxycyclohexane-1,2-dione acylhydrolase (decyclizing)
MKSMQTRRLTMAQALIEFLKNQYVERDGVETAFFAGAWGIFGHGNVAGIGQALHQNPDFRYYLCRNEQAAVHIATAFARANNRLRTFACVSSIGPGATNMVTGAAGATINRLPVLLLPGDIFARRNVAPVLQQLETDYTQDISVNDTFRPVSRYWDRLNRPEQLPFSIMEAMRVLTSPTNTGAVTLALPQDVQTEACDYPVEFLAKRVWHIARPLPEPVVLERAAQWIRASRRPLIIAGGGVIYSGATAELARLVESSGIPVGETQAGKGSLPFDHPQNLGAIGVTGTPSANLCARDADLIIGIGTRYTDFTTASKTAFQHPEVKFINLNVAEFDAFKQSGLPLVADARAALEQLATALGSYRVGVEYAQTVENHRRFWQAESDRIFAVRHGPPVSQGEIIGAVSRAARPQDVVVCAAGSLPGDLHKLWQTARPGGYHVEYGYSCMGYEIAGGLGVKMADPAREVYVMVGDGSFLMMSSEIVTSIQERYKLNIILLDNHGYSSIGGLSQSLGSEGFGTDYRFRSVETGQLDGDPLPVDFAAAAQAMGAHTVRARTLQEFEAALSAIAAVPRTSVIVIETDKEARVAGYESWWDVAVAEVSELPAVRKARAEYEKATVKERILITPHRS